MKSKVNKVSIVLLAIVFYGCPNQLTDSPLTDQIITLLEISNIATPKTGSKALSTSIDTEQYCGTIYWNPSVASFAASTVYTAHISLTAKTGYTFNGIAENSFTVVGATVTNEANSGLISAIFPKTESTPGVLYSVGDIGPSNIGIVFFISDGGLHGLESAPSGSSNGIDLSCKWKTASTWTYPNNEWPRRIGTGSENTAKMLYNINDGTDHIAANNARFYHGGGKTDWYLPSLDELKEMYIHRESIGNFRDESYWSSTQYNSSMAWGIDFNTGFEILGYKSTNSSHYKYTRSIRSF